MAKMNFSSASILLLSVLFTVCMSPSKLVFAIPDFLLDLITGLMSESKVLVSFSS
ncbi:hypothetical protein SLEP1_g42481 [Rubroshorea leprosula]|uniref:Uncharacterized protein n=1 Tax=Rubroshorea leprosula TaxID=152421 RepID=A0AAV5LAW0_9ROSI|nr:hypothetical protein SLEP1_g42481 [Rubroshorea leprosula]